MTAEFVDQDDYFDDDSDVPSHFDPSEELEESLVEEAVNFEPEHVEIEFDDEESVSSSACITEDWEEVKLDGDVTITNDCVDFDEDPFKEIKSFGSHELESLTPEVQLYHCFAASALWSHLQDMINRRHAEKRAS